MTRAYHIELTVLRDYGKQLILLGILVAALVSIGTRNLIIAPALMTCMFLVLAPMSTEAYDESNNWARLRLTMTLSRRDIVAARYLVIVTVGLIGMAVGLAVAAILSIVAMIVDLPGGLSAALTPDASMWIAAIPGIAVSLLLGTIIGSIITPVYFHFGQTKATQAMPAIIIFIVFVPAMLLGYSGLLDTGSAGMTMLTDFIAAITTPVGACCTLAVAVIVAAATMALSAAVSLRLYERREL